MTRARQKVTAAVAVTVLLAVSACSGSNEGSGPQPDNDSGNTKDVEVFTWWAAGGEKAGLAGMVSVFKKDCAQYNFVNAAGGGGGKAKTLLANNLREGKAPSSFQAHVGGELSDYIARGQVEDITTTFTTMFTNGGRDNVFPKDLMDQITVGGKIYAVPANIHRANVVWVNPAVLKIAHLNPSRAPATVKDWLADLARLRAAGVAFPLAMSKGFAQEMLLETTLLGDLGVDRFNGLFDGSRRWDGTDVTAALTDFKTLLSYANTDRETMDWDAALSRYLVPTDRSTATATAGYQLMGDWVPAQLRSRKVPDSAYTWWPAPGTDGVYQWLSDSFTLPKDATNPAGARCWLGVVGSAAGQAAFNRVKGSIPARSDAKPAGYSKYQQWAMAQWKAARLAPSLAHGSAGPAAWNNEVQLAMSAFAANPDVTTLQRSLVAAAAKYSKWQQTPG